MNTVRHGPALLLPDHVSPPLCRRTGLCIADQITMSQRQLPPFWLLAKSAPCSPVRPPQSVMLPFSHSPAGGYCRCRGASTAPCCCRSCTAAGLHRLLGPNCCVARIAACGCCSGCSARTAAPRAPWQATTGASAGPPRAVPLLNAAAAPPQWIRAASTASPGPRP